jgi:hypothetical protein
MPWTRDDLMRLTELEAHQQGVDPRLAVALAEQESNFDHTARSPKGAYGVMQLMPGTARQLKVNRDDPADNIRGGVTYLKQQLDAFGGDPAHALAAYNAGPGVVKAYGKVPPYKETQGFVSRILGKLGPSSAEAAAPQAQPQTAGMSRLEELEAHLARLEGQQTPQATTPTAPAETPPKSPQIAPGSTTPPRQDIPPAPLPDPTATPGMRFQALPSITQLEPADRMQKTTLFEFLKPAQQEEFLRSEEPTAGGLAMGGGPVAQSQPVTDPAALLAMGKRAPGWREGDPLPPGARRPPTPTEAPVTEGITEPSTMIPLILGMGIPGLTVATPGMAVAQGALTKALPKAGPLITRGARVAGEALSQTAGWTAGKTAETGEVPSPGEIGKEAALNVATGGIVEIPAALRAAKNAALRSTPGAQILLNQRAVQEAEGLGKRVFNAEDKAVVGKAFDAVSASGEKLDTTPVRDLWNSLTLAERRVAENELNKISSTFTDALKTRKLGDWDIGDLQHLRSELRMASQSKRTPETQDLLQSLRSSVDEAIHNGMAKGSLPAADLIAAQKAYRKVMQADDLQSLVTRHTKDSPNLKWQELNLAALNKEIRGGGKKSSQRLVAGMDATERQALQQELDSLAKRYPFVKTTRLVGNLASAGGLLQAGGHLLTGNVPAAGAYVLPAIANAAMRSPRVMSLFKQSILDGKGQLAQHHVDALLNAIRHENEGETPAQ